MNFTWSLLTRRDTIVLQMVSMLLESETKRCSLETSMAHLAWVNTRAIEMADIAQFWEQLSPDERERLSDEAEAFHRQLPPLPGFSIGGGARNKDSGRLMVVVGPRAIEVPADVKQLLDQRRQLDQQQEWEHRFKMTHPAEPVKIAGAPKPAPAGKTLSERAASIKNTPRGQTLNRAQRRREARKRYG